MRAWDLATRTDEAETFVRAAGTVNFAGADAVTVFVNGWGVLGVGFLSPGIPCVAEAYEALLWPGGTPTDESTDVPAAPLEVRQLAHCDSLAATRVALEEFQAALHQLEALRRRRRPDEHAWRAFANVLGQRLFSVHPTIGWSKTEGPLPAWDVRTPVELLWMTLWEWATTPSGRLRRCRHCTAWFVAGDPRKEFCTRTCTNRASAAASYERKRRAMRRRR